MRLRRLGLFLGLGVLGMAAVACDSTGAAEPEVSVSAELSGTDEPFEVSATDPTETDEGRLAHGVVVTWRGDGGVVLDDARFTHHVEDGDGHLILAGRGCGAQWDESGQDVLQACTADLQIIPLASGESHEYPVTIWPEVGPLTLEPGTYVAEETIAWWHASESGDLVPSGEPAGTFVVRLTYEVR